MILPITKHTNHIWRKKFKSVAKIDQTITKLVHDMYETLEFTGGVGLAAPQVASDLLIFIINWGSLKETFINPRIIKRSKETSEIEEGCLSVPGFRGLVKRSNEVEVDYLDIKGVRKRAALTNFYAKIAQHEIDHLSSVFYSDRIIDQTKLYQFKPVRIVFFGTDRFGAIILKSLIGQSTVGDYTIPLVISTADKPSGRDKKLTPSPVKLLADDFKLAVETPNKLSSNPEIIKSISTLSPDIIVVASYGKILPKEILEIPKKGSLNVHPSLLPKYKGASPIQTAIANNEKYTGVTIILMDEGVDTGNILTKKRLKIESSNTYQSLELQLAKLGAEILNQTIHLWVTGKIRPKKQLSKNSTTTKLLKKDDGLINWQKPPKNLEALIRAYHPWPGVWTYYRSTESRNQKAEKKILKLLPNRMVQLEGKNPIKLKQFKQGYKDFKLDW